MIHDHILRTHRAVHLVFGVDRVDLIHNGKVITYDPLADDGHHLGHNGPVLREDPA